MYRPHFSYYLLYILITLLITYFYSFFIIHFYCINKPNFSSGKFRVFDVKWIIYRNYVIVIKEVSYFDDSPLQFWYKTLYLRPTLRHPRICYSIFFHFQEIVLSNDSAARSALFLMRVPNVDWFFR